MNNIAIGIKLSELSAHIEYINQIEFPDHNNVMITIGDDEYLLSCNPNEFDIAELAEKMGLPNSPLILHWNSIPDFNHLNLGENPLDQLILCRCCFLSKNGRQVASISVEEISDIKGLVEKTVKDMFGRDCEATVFLFNEAPLRVETMTYKACREAKTLNKKYMARKS